MRSRENWDGDMARELNISDGTTTVALNTSPAKLTSYMPRDGVGDTVEESAKVHYDTFANLRTAYTSVRRLLDQAKRRRMDPSAAKVYLQWRGDGAETLYRSEIHGGEANTDERGYDMDIGLTRETGWEGAEAALTLTNGGGSSSAGLTINNHTTGSAWHYFTVSGSGIAGDLPAKTRLELTCTTVGGISYAVVGMIRGTASWTSGAFLQAESQSGATSLGDGAASNGAYAQVGIGTNFSTPSIPLWGFNIGSAVVGYSDGRMVVPILRFRGTLPSSSYIRMHNSSFTSGEWQPIDTTKPFLLGNPFALPAIPIGGGPYTDYGFYVYGARPSSTSTLDIDYCAIFPTDGFKQFTGTVAQNHVLVEDAWNEVSYVRSSGSGVPYGMSAVGTGFKLLPGKDTTFVMLTALYSGSWTMAPGNTLSARLYYRPRRATV
jgi:hypothetical protein